MGLKFSLDCFRPLREVYVMMGRCKNCGYGMPLQLASFFFCFSFFVFSGLVYFTKYHKSVSPTQAEQCAHTSDVLRWWSVRFTCNHCLNCNEGRNSAAFAHEQWQRESWRNVCVSFWLLVSFLDMNSNRTHTRHTKGITTSGKQ